MKLEIMQRIVEAMKEIKPVIEKHGFLVFGIEDSGNTSWDFASIRIVPKPEPGSNEDRILKCEGF